MATSRAVNFQADTIRVWKGNLVLGMADTMSKMIQGSTREMPGVLTSLSKALDLKAMPRSKMRDTNMRIAREAQAAVVNGWKSRLPRHTTEGSRSRLTGRLGPALADPDNLAGTTDRVVSFVNIQHMNQEAAHWYRINYGAAGANLAKSQRKPRRFVIQLNGEVFGSFRDDLPPDQISWIPERIWWRGVNMFPRKSRNDKVVIRENTNGARAARFLDLGHAVVARQAPVAYEQMWREYCGEIGSKARERLQKRDIEVQGDLRLQRTGWSVRVRT